MSEEKIRFMLILGTIALMVIAIAIIVFIVVYQRKYFAKQSELSELETETQKALLDAVLTTKEIEQKRIAQELHDEIGSSVNAVKMSLISMDIAADVKKKLSDELLQISKNVRRISNELMPSVLDELGFHQALVHLVKKFQAASTINFEVHTELEEPYPLEKTVELSLYRVLQELMNNISKYSMAKNVILTIHHTQDMIEINLVDDGNGFIPSQTTLAKTDSLGLKNIISRLQQIQGTSEYKLNEPKGTKVTIHLKKP